MAHKEHEAGHPCKMPLRTGNPEGVTSPTNMISEEDPWYNKRMAMINHVGAAVARRARVIHRQATQWNAARMPHKTMGGTNPWSCGAMCIGASASNTFSSMPLPGIKPLCNGWTVKAATCSSVVLIALAIIL